jgi:hypothetical protein
MDDRYLSGRSIKRDSNKTVRSEISSRPGTMHETAWGKTVDGGDQQVMRWTEGGGYFWPPLNWSGGQLHGRPMLLVRLG